MIGHTKFITNRLLEQTDNTRNDFRSIDLFGNNMIQLTMSDVLYKQHYTYKRSHKRRVDVQA